MIQNKLKIAVIIKTCQGRPSVLWAVNSVIHRLKKHDFRIYISDEEPLDDWKKQFYDLLTEQGHYIELTTNEISTGLARNRLIKKLEDEELVLRMDDDFELGGEFCFSALETILNSTKEIGYCSDFERQIGDGKSIRSGSIRPAGGDIVLSPPKLIKKFHRPWRRHRRESGIRFSLAEHTRNLLLLKREVVDKVRWNQRLLVKGEHLDFMMSIREAGYKGSYTPDSVHYHRNDLTAVRHNNKSSLTTEYRGETEMKEVYKERWNCNRIVTKYPLSWYLLEAGRRLITI